MSTDKSSNCKYCLNCESPLSPTDHYCTVCGQNKNAYRHSIIELAKDFFGTIFNLDSKIWVTVRDIWIPSKLTKAYIAGRKKSYINPIRLFVVLLFFVLAITTSEYNKASENDFDMSNVHKKAAEYKMMVAFDSLTLQYPLTPIGNIDSVRTRLFNDVLDEDDQSYDLSTFDLLSKSDIHLRDDDIANLTKEEIFNKYEIETYLDKIIISKIVSTLKDPRGSIRGLIGNILWVVVLTILITSLLMKLFYLRGDHYLVEHIILQVHHHCFLFACICIGYVFSYLLGFPDISTILIASLSLTFFYILIDLKVYYKQSWTKTIIKFLMISTGNLVILLISVLLILVISFLVV